MSRAAALAVLLLAAAPAAKAETCSAQQAGQNLQNIITACRDEIMAEPRPDMSADERKA